MDIQMPDFKRLKLPKRFAAAAGKTVLLMAWPIICLSANALRKMFPNPLAAGMNGHILRPVDLKQIYLILAKLLLENK